MEKIGSSHMTTTRPIIPPYSEQPTLTTAHPRIILRPFRVDDLPALHELRSQIEVMKWTTKGRIDEDLKVTETWMKRFMEVDDELQNSTGAEVVAKIKDASSSPNTYNFVIVYTGDVLHSENAEASSEGVIGAAGCHSLEPEPECGYMIRKEYWGQGITTAVLKTFLTTYWKLDRKTIKLPYDLKKPDPNSTPSSDSHDIDDARIAPEFMKAEIDATNVASQRVLEKCGFQYQSTEVIEHNGSTIELAHYVLARP